MLNKQIISCKLLVIDTKPKPIMLLLRMFLPALLLFISCSTENEDINYSDTSFSVLLNGVEWKDFNKTQYGNTLQMSANGNIMADSSEENRVHISLKRILDDRQSISFRNVQMAEGLHLLEKSGDIVCKFYQSVGREDLLMCKVYELFQQPEATAKSGLANYIQIDIVDEVNKEISGSFNVSLVLEVSTNCASGGAHNLPDTLNFTEGKFKLNY